MSKLHPISATALNAFDTCPYRYRMESLDKLYPFQASAATSRGTVFHKAIEAYLHEGTWAGFNALPLKVTTVKDRLLSTKVDFEPDSFLAAICKSQLEHDEAASDRVLAAQLISTVHCLKYGEASSEMRDALLTTDRENFSSFYHIFQGYSGDTEVSVHVDSKWEKAPAGWGKYMTSANMDIFARLGNNSAFILDWKTGKYNPTYQEGSLQQNALYAAVTFGAFPEIETVHGRIVHPCGTSKGVISSMYTRGDNDVLKVMAKVEYLSKLVNGYKVSKDGTPFVKTKNGLCKSWCPVIDCEFNGNNPNR